MVAFFLFFLLPLALSHLAEESRLLGCQAPTPCSAAGRKGSLVGNQGGLLLAAEGAVSRLIH